MATKSIKLIGYLLLVITLSLVSIQLMDKVKIDVSKTDTKFYVNESGSFVLAGTETTRISGYTLKNLTLNTTINGELITINRNSDKIIDTYTFNSSEKNVEMFPVKHKIEIINSSGQTFIYKVSKILILNDSKIQGNTIKFGHNMKLEWDRIPDKTTLTKQTATAPYIELQYYIKSDYETFNIRFFDPDPLNATSVTASDNSASSQLCANSNVMFFANYTDLNTSLPIQNYSATMCRIRFNLTGSWTLPSNMQWNVYPNLYNRSRNITQSAVVYYQVQCNGTAYGYDYAETPAMSLNLGATCPDSISVLPLNSTGSFYVTYNGTTKTAGWYNNSVYAIILQNTTAINTSPSPIYNYRSFLTSTPLAYAYDGTYSIYGTQSNIFLLNSSNQSVMNISGPFNINFPSDIDTNGTHIMVADTANDIIYVYNYSLVNVFNYTGGFSPGAGFFAYTLSYGKPGEIVVAGYNGTAFPFNYMYFNLTRYKTCTNYAFGDYKILYDKNITDSIFVLRSVYNSGTNVFEHYMDRLEYGTCNVTSTYQFYNDYLYDTDADYTYFNRGQIFNNSLYAPAKGTSFTYGSKSGTIIKFSFSNFTGYSTGYTIPSFLVVNNNNVKVNFMTETASQCRISTSALNYTQMNNSNNCSRYASNTSFYCNTSLFPTYNTYNFYVACLSDSGNYSDYTTSSSNYFTAMFKSEPDLMLSGFRQNVNAEFKSDINISTEPVSSSYTVCIDINHPAYGVNVSCSSGNQSYIFNPTYFDLTTFQSGTSINLTSNGSVSFSINNRTNISKTTFNINAHNTSYLIENLTLSYGNYTRVYYGTLNGTNVSDNRFIYNNDNITYADLIYASSGYQTIYYNIVDGNSKTISFQLWGENAGSNFSVTDDLYNYSLSYISNTSTNTTNVSLFNTVYDDFNTYKDNTYKSCTTATVHHSEASESASCTEYYDSINGRDSSYGAIQVTSASYSTNSATSTSKIIVDTTSIEKYKKTIITPKALLNYTYNRYLGNPGDTGTASTSCTTSVILSNTPTGVSIYSIPGTTNSSSYSPGCRVGTITTYGSCVDNGVVQLVRNEPYNSSAYTFDVTVNGVNYGNTTSMVGPIYVGVYSSIYAQHGFTADCGDNLLGYINYSGIDNINFSGISNGYIVNNTFQTISSVESTTVYESVNNIPSALLITRENKPTGCTITYQTSNNNGTTYETTYSNILHTYLTTGKSLKWRANISCSSTAVASILEAKLTTISGSVTNITIDLLGDGTIEYSYNNTLNSTNSPQNVSFTSTQVGNQTGNYGIRVTAGTYGVIKVNNSNIVSSINPVTINTNQIQTCSNCTFNLSNVGLGITVSNLSVYYTGGNKTYTIIAHNTSYTNNITYNVTFYTSDYSWNLPSKLTYVDFYPRTVTSKNVTPYGQTNAIPIFNFTTNNFDSYPYNFSIYLNATNSCVNLTASNSSSKSTGAMLNSSWVRIQNNIVDGTNPKVWLWADLACTSATWKVWDPVWYFKACCSECQICTERLE